MRFKVERWTCNCRETSCIHSLGAALVNLDAERAQLRQLVADFAEELEAKLLAKLSAGRAGWDEEEWTVEQIKAALVDHVDKGDPVDVAAFAAFWWNRTEAAT